MANRTYSNVMYGRARQALWPALLIRRRWLSLKRSWLPHGSASDEALAIRIGRLFAEDPVLNVAEFEGKFALAPRGHLFRRLVLSGHYEPQLTALCIDLLDPLRDVMDVGANIGFHSVLFSKHAIGRKVLAIEPTANALVRLKRNIAMNDATANITIFEGVASNAPGWLDINTVDGLEEYSSIGAMSHPSISGATVVSHRVRSETLDQLAADHGLDCGFMKVDVEGAENLVFEGARHILEHHRPVIVAELSDFLLKKNGSSASAVIKFFQSLKYVVIDPLHPKETPGLREFGDIVCIPQEHPRARGL